MVQEEKLVDVLSEFARTLITDFPIQRILDHLVERIVEVLPVTAAGVTLISPTAGPRFIAASDDMALRCERLQSELGQGPCVAAYESGTAIEAPDLRTDGRFPQFSPAAVSAGLAAVFALPLRHDDRRIGALDLYRGTRGEIGAHDLEVAQTLADVAAAYLMNAQAREDAREATHRLQHGALHDALTGLPNRALLQARLEHASLRAQRSNTNAAILFVDLDRFKAVNDTHGHHVGDELLCAVAHRLSQLVRSGDTLARISGDEFVFLCEDIHNLVDAEILAARIGEAFSEPFQLRHMQAKITASVGLAFAGRGQDVCDELLINADAAMYQAKRRGGAGHHIYDLREASQIKHRNQLEMDLRSAVAEEELDVAYQPIIRCADGRITGVEALLRWTHPERGAVPPTSMIAIAEQSALINDIGAWVLERSCRDRARWLDEHPRTPLDLAVNVSARQLMSGEFSATLSGVLDRTGMDPTALILEITESIFIAGHERAITLLVECKERGLKIALDDFGTGYSSLAHLRRLPIDIVKLDQSFIADVGVGAKGAPIVEAATNMAHYLDLAVTAEGVETQYQSDMTHTIGCDFAQGYFYGRPMPASALDAQLGTQAGAGGSSVQPTGLVPRGGEASYGGDHQRSLGAS